MSFFSRVLYAQEDTTLRHIPENAQLEAYKYSGQFLGLPLWGYITGHNAFTDMEYAEKYEIGGKAWVKAIVSHHTGTSNSNEKEVTFNVYDVGSSGLPGSLAASETVNHSLINLNSSATVTIFEEPVEVSSRFFVSFQLIDYFHDPSVLGDDTLALLSSVDGSREQEDRKVYGRNVVRLHSLPNEYIWKDFGTENYRKLQFHLAIYPVVSFSSDPNALQEHYIATSNGIKFYNLYPNPGANTVNVAFELEDKTEVSFVVTDVTGREVLHKAVGDLFPGKHKAALDLQDVPNGNYFLFLTGNGQKLGQQININR